MKQARLIMYNRHTSLLTGFLVMNEAKKKREERPTYSPSATLLSASCFSALPVSVRPYTLFEVLTRTFDRKNRFALEAAQPLSVRTQRDVE